MLVCGLVRHGPSSETAVDNHCLSTQLVGKNDYNYILHINKKEKMKAPLECLSHSSEPLNYPSFLMTLLHPEQEQSAGPCKLASAWRLPAWPGVPAGPPRAVWWLKINGKESLKGSVGHGGSFSDLLSALS